MVQWENQLPVMEVYSWEDMGQSMKIIYKWRFEWEIPDISYKMGLDVFFPLQTMCDNRENHVSSSYTHQNIPYQSISSRDMRWPLWIDLRYAPGLKESDHVGSMHFSAKQPTSWTHFGWLWQQFGKMEHETIYNNLARSGPFACGQCRDYCTTLRSLQH